jgi:glycosyltransferase involved in cell wall biosynthesis
MSDTPLVSVVTPVYNGEEFLSQCIESVLAQTYSNWSYVIVNNCSTDRTLEIAQSYAAKDSRIRVHSNSRFAPIIENHNIALRQISSESKYCKVVFADDWLFPDCISEMVKVAEMHSSVGVVGAYGLDGSRVLWGGLLYPSTFVPGHELCRKTLSTGLYVFGTPTSLLMRSDLIRGRKALYDETNLHADHAACYDLLQESDFGFVHQVLTFSRTRRESNNTFAKGMDSMILGEFTVLLKYGPTFLTAEELRARLDYVVDIYYGRLAQSLVRLRGKEYWNYHRDRLQAIGFAINRIRLALAVARKILTSLLHPRNSLTRALEYWPLRFKAIRNRKNQDQSPTAHSRTAQQQTRSVAP